MTVLSDRTIQQYIQDDSLILGGDPRRARHCAYEFRPGRVVYGGIANKTVESIDFLDGRASSAVIKPTAVVWVRTREQVKIPHDMVGIWIQTNSLSRRGLLLLNTTLVEPGYEGYLSAHLVNLGSQPTLLKPNETIAKLVFLRLDQAAENLVKGQAYEDYDSFLDSLAASSTESFLRISEHIPDVQKHVATVLADEEKLTRERLRGAADQILDAAKSKLVEIEHRTFVRVGLGYVAGLLLGLAILFWAFPKLRDLDAESESRIREVVRKENEALLRQLQDVRAQPQPATQPPEPASKGAAPLP